MKEEKSQCCKAIKEAIYSDEGTGYYVCSKCKIEFIHEFSEEKKVIDRMQNQIIDNMEKSNYPMKVYIPPTDSNWEGEFDKDFLELMRKRFGRIRFEGDSELLRDDLKSFIRSLIQSEKEEILKVVLQFVPLENQIKLLKLIKELNDIKK